MDSKESIVSMRFTGLQNSNLLIANTRDLWLKDKDFTIEWFQYQTDNNPRPRILSMGTYTANSRVNATFAVWIESGTGILKICISGKIVWESSPLGVYKHQWNHFALNRQNGILSVFRNGSRIGLILPEDGGDAFMEDKSNPLRIGNEGFVSNGSAFGGFMTGFRWVAGECLYDSMSDSIDILDVLENTSCINPHTKILLLAYSSKEPISNVISTTESLVESNNVSWTSYIISSGKTLTSSPFDSMSDLNLIHSRSSEVMPRIRKAQVIHKSSAVVESIIQEIQSVPVEVPVEAPKEVPVEAPKEVPVEAPKEVPVEAPKEVPVEAPKEVPVEAPKEVPVEVPKEAPKEVPVEVPVEAPKDSSIHRHHARKRAMIIKKIH
jgi:hypothetical protein